MIVGLRTVAGPAEMRGRYLDWIAERREVRQATPRTSRSTDTTGCPRSRKDRVCRSGAAGSSAGPPGGPGAAKRTTQAEGQPGWHSGGGSWGVRVLRCNAGRTHRQRPVPAPPLPTETMRD